jgi:superoxide dismutase, Cu-Zn family
MTAGRVARARRGALAAAGVSIILLLAASSGASASAGTTTDGLVGPVKVDVNVTGILGPTAAPSAPAVPTPGTAPAVPGGTQLAHVLLRNTSGKAVGRVELRSLGSGGTAVQVSVWGLSAGFHGFHVHAVGVCNPGGPEAFESAGGHFNPTGSAEGMQAGAFPPLLVGPDGSAEAQFIDGGLRLPDLFGTTGTAIVVHALPDNLGNIPVRYTSGGKPGPDETTMKTGDSGARIACGVISSPAAGG